MANNQFKSTLKKIKDFDFSKELVISKLQASKEMVDFHHDRMKKSFPDMKEQEIWQKINNIVIRDNVFNAAMKEIVSCYEFSLDEKEIKNIVENIRKSSPSFEKARDEVLHLMAQRALEKELVFRDLQKIWKIEVSDKEVKEILQKMYEQTNYPIRDIINDEKKINNLKAPVLEQKTADAIIGKFKWKLDKEAIMKNASSAPQKEETKKEKKESK